MATTNVFIVLLQLAERKCRYCFSAGTIGDVDVV